MLCRTFDEIEAKFSVANNLLDVQRISADLYADQDFFGNVMCIYILVVYL